MRERDSDAAARRRPFLLLPSKIVCPLVDDAAVRREAVSGKLDGAARASVTTVVAPAGFGKTSAVAAWAAAQALPVAWCSLDEDDADPARFWYAVACALSSVPGLNLDPSDMADVPWADPAEARACITDLVLRLAQESEGAFLVLEDMHHIDDAPLVNETAAYFLRHLPPYIHLVLTSRTPVRLPLAKIRARGKLVEVTEADLRFTLDEQMLLFADLPQRLTPAELASVGEFTQGWPAGCRLVELRCRCAETPEALAGAIDQARLTMREYLLEEVVESLPADLLDFMTATSASESFCVPLAAAMTGLEEAEARRFVDRVVESGLFIQRLEGDGSWPWYRYHQLLRDLLRSRLRRRESEGASGECERARSWFLAEGFDDAAVSMAFEARDWEAVASIIEQRWKSLYMNDDLEAILRWTSLLPESFLADRPFLCAVAALPAACGGDLLGARRLVQRALLGLDENQDFFFAFCMVQEAYLSSLEGKPERSADFAEKALRYLPEGECYLRSMMVQVQVSALWGKDPMGALALYRGVLRDQRMLGNANLLCSVLCNLAVLEVMIGRMGDARGHAEEALGLYGEAERLRKPMLAFAWRVLCECAYEQRDDDAFDAASDAFDDLVVHNTVSARLAEMFLLRSKRAYDRGKAEEGREFLMRAFATDEGAAVAMLPTLAQVRDWVARYRTRAEATFETGGEGRGGFFAASVSYVLGREEAADRALAAAGGSEGADAPLRVRALVLAAIGAERAGRAQMALRLVREAFALSRDHGLIAAFAENASDMQPLVRLLRNPGSLGDDTADLAGDATIARVIEEASAPVGGASADLTARELDVLRLVADGATVAQAAEQLVVSRETVKKHLGNIYSKLGVHSKMQAVALLRDEGVL